MRIYVFFSSSSVAVILNNKRKCLLATNFLHKLLMTTPRGVLISLKFLFFVNNEYQELTQQKKWLNFSDPNRKNLTHVHLSFKLRKSLRIHPMKNLFLHYRWFSILNQSNSENIIFVSIQFLNHYHQCPVQVLSKRDHLFISEFIPRLW